MMRNILSRYVELLFAVLSDGFGELGIPFHRPTWDYLVRGMEQKGLEFFTLDLPALEKVLLVSLEDRRLPASWPVHDEVAVFAPLLPLLFSGDHPVTPEDRAQAARHLRLIRQTLLLFSKVKVLPSEEKIGAAEQAWFEVEETLKNDRTVIRQALTNERRYKIQRLYKPLFDYVEERLATGSLPFSHGPGAVSEPSVFGGKKFSLLFPTYTMRANRVRSRYEATVLNSREYEDRDLDDGSELVSPRDERPSRITIVPKTASSPRIIAMEPTVMQWGQQMLMQLFRDGVRLLKYTGVDWTDQTRNQDLARIGSSDGSLATLDLSEASDRLSLQVVAWVLPPYLKKWVMAFRSTRASFGDRVVRLEKFAPMGSALTFVLESLVFYGIIRTACEASGMDTTNQRSVNRRLSAYGDDLVVPAEYAPAVIEALEAFGLKVNRAKSFWSGYFRESCGTDWLYGYDVTVVRIRQPLEDSRSPMVAISLCESQNMFFERGFYTTARMLRSYLPQIPANNRKPTDGYTCLSEEAGETRWSAPLQRLEVKVAKPKFRSSSVDGWDGLRGWIASKREGGDWQEQLRKQLIEPEPPFESYGSRPKPVGLGYGWSVTTGLVSRY